MERYSSALSGAYYIGWDVGGWNCDKNGKSRDSIVILDATLRIVGEPWRGNLRTDVNTASTTADWLAVMFGKCKAVCPVKAQVTMGIDTPLGFSEPFVRLITQRSFSEPVKGSGTNQYLFRQTELFLIRHGIQPLSAIKDMIGSQATKGMHSLAKFAPIVESCGLWSDGQNFSAIEAYPSACKNSQRVKELIGGRCLGHQDKDDALTCALIAYLFANERDELEQPTEAIPVSEGWIWVPKLSRKAPLKQDNAGTADREDEVGMSDIS